MWVKSEIFCLALQILKNQDTSVSKKTIIRSLSIKCNFTRMLVFKMADEAFVIHTLVCVNCHYVETRYFQCLQRKVGKIKKPISTA